MNILVCFFFPFIKKRIFESHTLTLTKCLRFGMKLFTYVDTWWRKNQNLGLKVRVLQEKFSHLYWKECLHLIKRYQLHGLCHVWRHHLHALGSWHLSLESLSWFFFSCKACRDKVASLGTISNNGWGVYQHTLWFTPKNYFLCVCVSIYFLKFYYGPNHFIN